MPLTVEQIARVLDRKREHHPELGRAVAWPGMQRVCDREGVELRVTSGRMPRIAQLVPCFGGWTILLSREAPARRRTYLAAHELGHLWLHHDSLHDRAERVYNMDQHWPDDPREDDAELFASLILMGPTRARPHVALSQGEHESSLHFALRTLRRDQLRRGPR